MTVYFVLTMTLNFVFVNTMTLDTQFTLDLDLDLLRLGAQPGTIHLGDEVPSPGLADDPPLHPRRPGGGYNGPGGSQVSGILLPIFYYCAAISLFFSIYLDFCFSFSTSVSLSFHYLDARLFFSLLSQESHHGIVSEEVAL